MGVVVVAVTTTSQQQQMDSNGLLRGPGVSLLVLSDGRSPKGGI